MVVGEGGEGVHAVLSFVVALLKVQSHHFAVKTQSRICSGGAGVKRIREH